MRIIETAEKVFIATVYGFEPTTGDEQIQEIAEAALKFSKIFHAEADKFEAPYVEEMKKQMAEHFRQQQEVNRKGVPL